MASQDDSLVLFPETSPGFTLPSPQKTTPQTKTNEALKRDRAETNPKKMSVKEKKKTLEANVDDMEGGEDVISVCRIRSAEALARMRQVQNMISHYEWGHLSDTSGDTQDSGMVCEVDAIADSEQQEQGDTDQPQEDRKELSNIWQKALKPVSKRIGQIQHVLSDTSTSSSRSLCSDEDARLNEHKERLKSAVNNFSLDVEERLKQRKYHSNSTTGKIYPSGTCEVRAKNKSATMNNNRQVQTRLEEEKMKNCMLQEKLHDAVKRSKNYEVEMNDFTVRLNDSVKSYDRAFDEQLDKNNQLESELVEAKEMQEELTKRVEIIQNMLHEEKIKNAARQKELNIEELKKQLCESQQMACEEQMKNAQLQDEMLKMKDAVCAHLNSLKEDFEVRLHNAEEMLDEERRLNVTMVRTSARAKTKTTEMEKDLRKNLHAVQDQFDEEKALNVSMINDLKQQLLQVTQDNLAEEANIVNDLKQKLNATQDELEEQKTLNVSMTKDLEQQLQVTQSKLDEAQALNSKLVKDFKQQMHINLDNRKAPYTVKEHDDALRLKLDKYNQELLTFKELLDEVMQKNSLLQDKLCKEEKQSLTLKDQLEYQLVKSLKLEDTNEKAFEKMREMESELEKRLQAFKEVIAEEQDMNTSLQTTLSDISQATNNEVSSREEYVDALKDMLEKEKKKTAMLEEKNNIVSTQLKNHEECLQRKLNEHEDELNEEKMSNTLLINEMHGLRESFDTRMRCAAMEYNCSLDCLQNKLIQEQIKSSKLEDNNSKSFVRIRNLELELKETVKCSQDEHAVEQKKIAMLHEELDKAHGSTTEVQSMEGEYKHAVQVLQNIIEVEKKGKEKLQDVADKARAQMQNMEKELMKRLQAFKEVFVEEQDKMAVITDELCAVKKEANSKIALLKKEVAKLKTEREGIISEKRQLEWELERRKRNAKSSISFSTVDSMEAQNVNNNQTLTSEERGVEKAKRNREKVNNFLTNLSDAGDEIDELSLEKYLVAAEMRVNRSLAVDHKELSRGETQLYLTRLLASQREATKEQDRVIIALQTQMQDAENEWEHLADNASRSKSHDSDVHIMQLQAISSLFGLFHQLLKTSITSAEKNDILVQEISHMMSLLSKATADSTSGMDEEPNTRIQQEHQSVIRQLKLDYEQRLMEDDFKLRLAEEKIKSDGAVVEQLMKQINDTNATISEMSAKDEASRANPLQQCDDEKIHDLRGKVRQQEYSLDDAARERRQWQSKVDDLKYQLETKNEELGEKRRSVEKVTKELSEMHEDIEREKRQKQRLQVKHFADQQDRDAEVRNVKTKMKQLEDTIKADMRDKETADQMNEAEILRLKLEYDEKMNDNASEFKALKHQVQKAESRTKAMEGHKDNEIKQLNAKLENAKCMLRNLQREQSRSMGDCNNKVNMLRSKLDFQAKHVRCSKSIDDVKASGLRASNKDVMSKVQTMLHQVEKIEDVLQKDDLPPGRSPWDVYGEF